MVNSYSNLPFSGNDTFADNKTIAEGKCQIFTHVEMNQLNKSCPIVS